MNQPLRRFGRRISLLRQGKGQNRKRTLSSESLEDRVMLASDSSPWQNPMHAEDVNADRQLNVTDALIVINDLLSYGARDLPVAAPSETRAASGAEGEPTDPIYVDVNGDNVISPLDAIIVINALLQERAPTVSNDSFTVGEDSTNNFLNVLQNDLNAVAFIGTPTAANGTVTQFNDPVNGLGLRYTPNPNFFGTETFNYTVRDSAFETASATVTITVTSVNDPPQPHTDIFQIDDGSTNVPLNVLVNDFQGPSNEGAQGTGLQIIAVSTPTGGGTVTINGTNSGLIYTPPANFVDFDTETFTYTVQDSGGLTATATVGISANDFAIRLEIQDLAGNPIDTIEVGDDFRIAAFVDDLRPDVFQPSELNALGVVTAAMNLSWMFPTVGFTGPINFIAPYNTLTSNGTAGTNSITDLTTTYDLAVLLGSGPPGGDEVPIFTAQFTAQLATPTANSDTASVFEDSGATTFNVLTNDTLGRVVTIASQPATSEDSNLFQPPGNADDIVYGSDTINVVNDTAAVLTIVAVSAVGSQGGTIVNNGTSITYTPPSNFVGTETFTYTISDGTAPSSTTVTVNVLDVNDPPTALDDSATVNEDSSATTINVLANDTISPDTGETLTVTGVGAFSNGGTATFASGTSVQYTPAPDFYGTETFTYTVSDGVNTDTATVTVTVNPIVDIVNDTATTTEDTPVTLNVLANDNFEGTPSVTAVTQGANGTVTFLANGTVTYTPNADFNGSDSFTYTATSGGVTETATVNVTINAAADVVDDSVTTNEDTPVTFNVLTNDNFEGSPTVTAVTQGANGTVTFLANGTVTYTPNADFNGSDSFTYTATSAGTTEMATVFVTVNPVADAVDDSVSTNEDTPVTFNVLTNDNFEAVPLVTAVTQGANGSVVFLPNGTITYTPNADFNGSDSFTYTATSAGLTETATVFVTVNPVADAVDDSATVNEDTPVTFNVLTNDNFEGSPSVTGVTQGANGTVSNNGGGSVTYIPNADFYGSDSFTYTVTSGGVTESATVFITVNPVVDIADDSVTTNEDTPVTLNVLTNDSFEGAPTVTAVTQGANGSVAFFANGTVTYTPNADFNGSDSFTYTATSGGVTETATVFVTVNAVADIADDSVTTNEDTPVTLNVLTNDSFEGTPAVTAVTQGANGTVTFLANGVVTYTPNPDFNGSDSFTYTATSGGVTETATVFVTVNPVADVANDSATTAEDTPVTLNVLTNDNFEGTPSVTAVTQGANGTVTFLANGTITYTPNADFNGSDSFTYTATSGGVTETAVVNVTVTPVADVANDSATTNEDTPVTFNVLTNDNFEGAPTVTAVTQGANGTVTFAANGDITYTPAADFNGSDSFTYTATSGGVTETANVFITVNPVADIADDSVTTNEDMPVTISVLANDSFEGTPAVTAVTQGANGTVTFTAGNVTYSPSLNFNGSDSFTYTATSGGVTETATVFVTVTPVDDGPAIANDDSATAVLNTSKTLNPLANDTVAPDFNETLTITGVGSGLGANQTGQGGTVTVINGGLNVQYTPDTGFLGTDTFTYTISDGSNNSTATVTVVVSEVSANDDTVNATEDQTANFNNLLANDDLGPGPTLISVVGSGGSPNVTANGGTLAITGGGTGVQYTPAGDFNGTDSFTYTISDGSNTATGTVTVLVAPVDDGAPIAANDSVTATEDMMTTFSNLLINDTAAPDNNETLSITGVGGFSNGGSASFNSGQVFYTPAADFYGTETFTYTINDGTVGNDSTAMVTITVSPVADVVDDSVTTNEDTPVTVNVLSNDNFEGSPSVTAVTQGANGTVTFLANGTITYTPNADFNGNDSFTYTATSGGVTETATVFVTVNAVADVADDSVTTNEDTPVTFNVLTNDNFEGSPSVTGVTQGANGTVTFAANGTLTYTPNADFNGSDSFTYTATSGGVTETATVFVTVNAVADVVDDSVTTNEDTPVTFNVLTNDNFEGSPSVTGVTQGANGTVTFAANGTLTYTPNADFNGSDSFTYTATSGGVTETATVFVTVNAVADVVDDSATTTEDTPVTLNVLTNDNFEGSPSVTAVTQGANGTVTFAANGDITYTPNADFNGSDSFTYTATSGGVTETATVFVTVNAVADVMDDSATTTEDTPVTLNVLTNDNFEGSPSVTAVTQGANGTVAFAANGDITYTPNADFNGSDSFTYTATSGGVTETATVFITVNAAADIADDSVTTNEDTPVTLNVLTNDSFEGTASVTAVTQGASGSVTFLANGTITYTPNADFNGSDSFSYTATSGGVTETATVFVTVNPVADVVDDSVTTNEDTPVTFNVLTNDNFEGSPTVTGVTQGANGTVAFAANGTLTYTPNADFNGSDSFTYTATSAGVTETATVFVTVNPVADAVSDSATTTEDTPVTLNVLTNDNFEAAPSVTAVTQGANGTVTFAANGDITYTPNADFNGSDSFTYTVTSGGQTETAAVNVTITPVADAVDDSVTTNEDMPVTFNVLANDNFEASPSVTAVTQGANGTVTFAANGDITYTPSADFNGSDSFTYTATSGGVTETATVNVTINSVNDDPTANDDSATVVLNGGPQTIDVLANDTIAPDTGETLTITNVSPGSNGGTATISGGVILFDPAAIGTETFTYTISDGTTTDTATVTVNTIDYIPSNLSGFVYLDTNNNGIKEAVEAGLGGVKVTLTGTDFQGNSVNIMRTTMANGSYSFAGIVPGTYVITETHPAGLLDGLDTETSPAATVLANDQFQIVVPLAGDVQTTTLNFGERGKTSEYVSVWDLLASSPSEGINIAVSSTGIVWYSTLGTTFNYTAMTATLINNGTQIRVTAVDASLNGWTTTLSLSGDNRVRIHGTSNGLTVLTLCGTPSQLGFQMIAPAPVPSAPEGEGEPSSSTKSSGSTGDEYAATADAQYDQLLAIVAADEESYWTTYGADQDEENEAVDAVLDNEWGVEV